MRKLAISLVFLALAFLIACSPYAEDSFKSNFAKLRVIESGYGISFSTERVNETILTPETAGQLEKDVVSLKEKISRGTGSEQKDASLLFMDARLLMLEAQKHYIMAKSYGKQGDIYDGFRCTDYPYVLNASYHYNLTYWVGDEAMFQLDEVLRKYNFTKEIVGVDETRPMFYKGPWLDLKKRGRSHGTIQKLCKDSLDPVDN